MQPYICAFRLVRTLTDIIHSRAPNPKLQHHIAHRHSTLQYFQVGSSCIFRNMMHGCSGIFWYQEFYGTKGYAVSGFGYTDKNM